MTQNSGASLYAYFGYRDAVAALRWLEEAFGFETTAEYPDDKGGIMHAEMRRDDVAITEWGNYRCRVADPEGFEWTFGTHKPGQPTTEWSEE